MADWDVQRTSGKCAATGRELAPGEEFYAVLFDRDGVLERADYSIDAWTGPPDGAFCVWRSRVPVKKQDKPLWVDDDVLVNLFVRLGGETDGLKRRFRFVLALLLMRKKWLKYEQTLHDGDREFWQMRLIRPSTSSGRAEPVEGRESASGVPAGGVHPVENPHLSDAEIEQVSAQLRAILQGDVPDDLRASMTADEPLDDDAEPVRGASRDDQ